MRLPQEGGVGAAVCRHNAYTREKTESQAAAVILIFAPLGADASQGGKEGPVFAYWLCRAKRVAFCKFASIFRQGKLEG